MMQQLMQMAQCKYADLVVNGMWACPNADQEKLITLSTAMNKFNKAAKK